MKKFKFSFVDYDLLTVVYDNEGDDKGSDDKGSDDKGNDDKGSDDKSGDDKSKKPEHRSYSQDELERAVLAERKKAQEQTRVTIQSLEKLKESQSISEQEKQRLAQQIDDLNRTLLSKEELAKRDKEKLVIEHKNTLDSVTRERDTWKNRFEENQIVRAITDAAIQGEAFNPRLIVPLLKPNAALLEGTGPDGKPNGVFAVKIRLSEVDANGEEKVLSFSPEDAIKVMKDRPNEYGQLFKGNTNGGTGGGASTNNIGKLDPSKMSHDEFMAHRATLTGRKPPVKK